MAEHEKKPNAGSYKEWLKITGVKDTKLNKAWFYTPEDKQWDFIQKHKGWWRNF